MEGGDLARLWKGGKKGCLSPLMQAKAWGLSEAGAEEFMQHQCMIIDHAAAKSRAPKTE